MTMTEKTLAILTPGFPESEMDTTCLPMQQDFVRRLKINYPQLRIIVLTFQYPYVKKRYDWNGVMVISFDGRNKGSITRLMLRKKIRKALKEINNQTTVIGLLSFWYGECAWVGKHFADEFNLKHYCWIMGQDARKGNKYPGKVGAQADELIALSDFLQSEFRNNYGVMPARVIPPGIQTQPFTASSQARDIDILAVGSLIPLKQYSILLDLIKEMKSELPEIKAAVVGKGPEKKLLEGRIAELGLESNLKLFGEVAHEEVLAIMRRAKILVHPSSYEGFSGVCLEALSQGTQVISFCKAMNQQIQHWKIVQSTEEMKNAALAILLSSQIDHSPIVPYSMSDSANSIMELFDA